MTLEEAMALASQDCPLPRRTGDTPLFQVINSKRFLAETQEGIDLVRRVHRHLVKISVGARHAMSVCVRIAIGHAPRVEKALHRHFHITEQKLGLHKASSQTLANLTRQCRGIGEVENIQLRASLLTCRVHEGRTPRDLSRGAPRHCCSKLLALISNHFQGGVHLGDWHIEVSGDQPRARALLFLRNPLREQNDADRRKSSSEGTQSGYPGSLIGRGKRMPPMWDVVNARCVSVALSKAICGRLNSHA